MKVSYNWLKSYLDFNLTSSELSNLLTNTGLEVEKEVPRFKDFESLNELVIGHVVSCEKHPNADKLKIAKVDVGDEICSIVCGASNIKMNINVVVAKVGVAITNVNNESFKIKKSKIRGEYSFGMICSEFEIGLGLNNDGIMILDSNFNNEIGVPLSLINASPKSDYLVLEIGASKFNDIDHLSKIIKPDVGIITNIGNSHLEELKNTNGVLKVKSEIITHIKKNGFLVVPNDNEKHLSFWKKVRKDINIVTFGKSKSADFYSYKADLNSDGANFYISSKNLADINLF